MSSPSDLRGVEASASPASPAHPPPGGPAPSTWLADRLEALVIRVAVVIATRGQVFMQIPEGKEKDA